jgi:hypothetical protein
MDEQRTPEEEASDTHRPTSTTTHTQEREPPLLDRTQGERRPITQRTVHIPSTSNRFAIGQSELIVQEERERLEEQQRRELERFHEQRAREETERVLRQQHQEEERIQRRRREDARERHPPQFRQPYDHAGGAWSYPEERAHPGKWDDPAEPPR